MKEEHAQELAQLIEDELPRSYGSVRPRVPTHSAHRRPEALREGQHALVAHGLRLRAPARRHLDEAVDAGLVEVLALVLLHHARLHHVHWRGHERRNARGHESDTHVLPERHVVHRFNSLFLNTTCCHNASLHVPLAEHLIQCHLFIRWTEICNFNRIVGNVLVQKTHISRVKGANASRLVHHPRIRHTLGRSI